MVKTSLGELTMKKLKQCFECEEYTNTEWYEILTTEDDGYSLRMCQGCVKNKMAKGWNTSW